MTKLRTHWSPLGSRLKGHGLAGTPPKKTELVKQPVVTSTRGAIAELRVAAELLGAGYHVFRALSPACAYDLVILTQDRALTVEVRTTSYAATGDIIRQYGKPLKDRADIYAWVLPDWVFYEPELPPPLAVPSLRVPLV